jgi:hypothetical protein
MPDVELTVFLGFYNASPYFKKIEAWLQRLNLAGAKLILVDNASTDGTWDWIHGQLIPLLGDSSITAVRNPINVGGYGSLALNLDLVEKSKWLMTLHQDDSYSPDHIVRHLDAIRLSKDNLGMISSESISVSPSGKKLSYPRGSWLLGDSPEPADVFIANLRSHSYPFSGASFRVDLLNSIQVPWHSTSFPDTEIVLRAAASWKSLHLARSTVQYLENPKSESHSLNQAQKETGSFLALIRVFRSQEFISLVQELDINDMEKFALGVNSSLKTRFSSASLLGLLQAVAQETIIQVAGPNRSSSSMLSSAFNGMGDHQASSTLDALVDFETQSDPANPEFLLGKISFSDDNPITTLGQETHAAKSDLIPWILGVLPNWLAKFIYLSALKLLPIRHRLPQWDFRWKK